MCQCLQPNFNCRVINVSCGPGALKHPSELLSQLEGSLSPHSSIATGTGNNHSWTDKTAEAKSFCFKAIKEKYCTFLLRCATEHFLEGLRDVLQQGTGSGFPPDATGMNVSAGEQRLVLLNQTSTGEEITLWQECLKAKYTKNCDEVKYYSSGNCIRLQWAVSSECYKKAKVSGIRGNWF